MQRLALQQNSFVYIRSEHAETLRTTRSLFSVVYITIHRHHLCQGVLQSSGRVVPALEKCLLQRSVHALDICPATVGVYDALRTVMDMWWNGKLEYISLLLSKSLYRHCHLGIFTLTASSWYFFVRCSHKPTADTCREVLLCGMWLQLSDDTPTTNWLPSRVDVPRCPLPLPVAA